MRGDDFYYGIMLGVILGVLLMFVVIVAGVVGPA